MAPRSTSCRHERVVPCRRCFYQGVEMPKKLEDKLKKEARDRGYTKEQFNRFVYGTLRKTGWKPKQEK